MIKLYLLETFKVECWFSTTLKELEAKIQEDYPDDTLGSKAKGWTASWMVGYQRKLCIYASSPAALAHECVHAANAVLRWTGQKPDEDNDELFCYIVEDIFRQYCKAVKPSWNRVHG